jgi:hypothetical protein
MNKFRRSLLSILAQSKIYDRKVNYVVGTSLTPLSLEFNPTNNTVLELDVIMNYTNEASLFGCTDVNRFYVFQYRNIETYFYTGTSGYPYANISSDIYNNRTTWRIQKGGLYINDVLKIPSNADIAGNQPIYIFNSNDKGAPYANSKTKTNIRVYGVKLYDNGVLVRDMIPVSKDGSGYLFDKISKTLFSPLTGNLSYA